MGFKKFNSIRQQFTFRLSLVISIILFIFSFFLIRYNNETAKENLSRQLINISNIATVSLSTALWQYNHEYVSDYIDSLFLYEDIVFVQVFSEIDLIKSKTIPNLNDKNIEFFKNSKQFILKESHINFNSKSIGRIIVVMSYNRIDQLIVSNSTLAIFLLCIIIFAILITNYILINRYIFTPVDKLKASAESIASGDLDAQINTETEDEIGDLAKTFQQMMLNIKRITTSRDKLNHEVKERQKTQKALEESNQRFGQLANNTSDLFWLIDTTELESLKVIYLNPSFEFIWHQKIEDIYNSPMLLLDSIHPDDKDNVFDSFINFLKEKKNFHLEFRILRPDNSIRYLWARGNLIYDKTGSLIHVAGIAQDITERFKAQKEKEHLKNQLQHAHKMEAIGTLAGGIAHDFNNILGIIIGNAELAIDDVPKKNPARLSLEEIITASKRAKDVVWQLLSFSRKSEREKKPVVISTILKEVMALLRSSIPRTIDIKLILPDTESQIKADATQIHQVLLNLCTNAAHAMGDTGGKLEVKLEDLHINLESLSGFSNLSVGKHLKISVKDTGPGIDPNIQDRIFDPYFTTKPVGKGTGMGLAVVHGIVKSHSGDICLKSALGVGATFEIIFPALTDDVIIKAKKEKEIPIGNERILLVDDEQSLLDIGQRMLTRLGYSVISQTDPQKAIDLYKQDPDAFDLVITDMTMPAMTGDQLIQQILHLNKSQAIILCTGYSETLSERDALQMGIKKYIEKPLNMQELATSVREIFDLKV